MLKRIALAVVALLGGTSGVQGESLVFPSSSSPTSLFDTGFYAGDSSLTIDVTGTADLISGGGYFVTNPDGSLTKPMTYPGYSYFNVGATNYPTVAGGDGKNHYAGGGGNYDTSPVAQWGHFGFAGLETTDTTNFNTIRFGSVVGTFSPNPTRADWFNVGYGQTLTVPSGGAHLYLAVNDGSTGNNVGNYTANITGTPVAPIRKPLSPSTTDLWDISQGATITKNSDVVPGSNIQSMFGGTNTLSTGEKYATVFQNNQPSGYVHYVEWQTPQPITLRSFAVFLAHDAPPTDLRAVSSFKLYAYDTATSTYHTIYTLLPQVPYGNTPLPDDAYFAAGTGSNQLFMAANIDAVTAQKFRAEFVQYGVPYGPRIGELDGFSTTFSIPEPSSFALCGGAMAVGLLVWVKRRNRK